MSSSTHIAQQERLPRFRQARLEQISEARKSASLVGAAVGIASELTDENITLLAQAAFEEFLKAPEKRDPRVLAQYMTLALRTRDLELKGSAHELAREKHYFNLAKKALEYVGKLKSINDSSEDERAKIEKVMVLMFGADPIGFESPKQLEGN
jgi:hypothetical protein